MRPSSQPKSVRRAVTSGMQTMCAAIALAMSVFATPPATLPAQQAASTGRALTIEDYYRVRTVSAPVLSQDGRWVAFTVGTRVESTNGNTSAVWLVAADGSSGARRISTEGANATAPSWLANGQLRFVMGARGVVVDPAMPDVRDTTPSINVPGVGGRGGRGNAAPSVQTSPDGKWVASIRDVPLPKRPRVALTAFEDRHDERFKGVQFDWMDFHRDGAPFPTPNVRDPEINPPQEIFLSSSVSSEARPLTTLGVRPTGLQWRKDGAALLFSADSTYRNERIYGRTDIWTLTPNGQIRRLTPNTDFDYNGARYSPDGRFIVASRQLTTDHVIAQKLDHGGATDIVVFAAEGGAERVLTQTWDYLPSNIQWSPDGRFIYFTGGIGGSTHLFRVSPEGGDVQQITTGERQILSISMDRGFTRMAYLVGLKESPSEIWSANIDGTNERQLTRIHDAFVKEIALSRSERLQYKSTDGTPIEGWLMLPHAWRADGGPYPLIVSNHGGPHSAITYNFNFKNQYLAANGYFVLEVNFRSSTGYGEKFLWGTWGAWGTKDGQDVMSGIDHVLGKYRIDRQHVASIGHSYGGFMTNWLITQYPDRFAAAIPGAGIVNWVSDYGNADIPRTKETEFFGAPWDAKARDIMIRQSPLTYANRVKAPTLFINGEVDQRVPFSEAQQMYVALKKNGVPARMIQYAGQAHGITGSWNQVHRMLHERRWLDQWLKPVRQ